MLKKLWFTGMILLLVYTMSACGGSSDASNEKKQKDHGGSQTLVVVDWGGEVNKAREKNVIKPFEEKYNVNVQLESPTDYGKLKAMVEGGNVTWDVVNVDTYWGVLAGEKGLLEPLDYNIIHKDHIIPDQAKKYVIGSNRYSVGIAYNTDKFSNNDHPKTWAEFWDTEKFPGSRGLYKGDPADTIEIALLADGVKPEELYPLDLDRAFKSLDKLKAKTDIVWWDAGAQPAQLLSTGSVSVSSAWAGRIIVAKSDGAPVGLEYNQGIISGEGWVVPKGSKNKELAMKFIDFASSAKPQADHSTAMWASPVNKKAIDMLPEDVRNQVGASSELEEIQIHRDFEWWAENFDEVSQLFQEWLLKN